MLGWFKKKKMAGEDTVPESAVMPSEDKQVEENAAEPTFERARDGKDDLSEGAAPGEAARKQEIRQGLFMRLQERLAKTRESFVSRVDDLFLGKKEIDAQLLEELEEILITADLGVNTTMDLLDEIRNRMSRQELRDPRALKLALKESILSFFAGYADAGMHVPATGPFVIMVVGVNGVGKTTTIGKMASKFARSGQRVLLVAADTFRAAAIDQLKIWGERVGADVVAKEQGVDPSAVIYDGLDYAASRDFDVIIVDTAGRLHTKVNLMEELKKIKRVINKKIEGAPHEIMLILDATTGQNSISQTRLFNEAVGLSGLTLTKLDGTAKGGIVVNISHGFNIPIRFIGIGEKLEDLRDFEPREFIDALFANGSGL
jgi:fused signal recognition particle receptor